MTIILLEHTLLLTVNRIFNPLTGEETVTEGERCNTLTLKELDQATEIKYYFVNGLAIYEDRYLRCITVTPKEVNMNIYDMVCATSLDKKVYESNTSLSTNQYAQFIKQLASQNICKEIVSQLLLNTLNICHSSDIIQAVFGTTSLKFDTDSLIGIFLPLLPDNMQQAVNDVIQANNRVATDRQNHSASLYQRPPQPDYFDDPPLPDYSDDKRDKDH